MDIALTAVLLIWLCGYANLVLFVQDLLSFTRAKWPVLVVVHLVGVVIWPFVTIAILLTIIWGQWGEAEWK